jgi:butyryl-CoA dehydrogenase
MLDERHVFVQRAVRAVAERAVRPLAARVDREDYFPREAIRALGEAGHLGSLVPESYGGGGADLLTYVLTVEALAAASPAVAWITVVHSSATMAIAATGTEEQKQRWLPALARGERLASFAFTEANAGADFFAAECTARAADGGYEVRGSKIFISLATEADYFLVLARTQREAQAVGLSMLVIERGATGFAVGARLRGMGMRGIGWGEIVLDECRVAEDARLGPEGKGTRGVFGMAGAYLLGAAALALGIADGAYQSVATRLRSRVVAGKALGGLEALQFRAADLSARIEAARALVYRACGESDPRSLLPFQAKLFASETALDVTRAALQLGGATAFAEDADVQRFARDAFAVPLHFENNDFLRRFVGRTLLGGSA